MPADMLEWEDIVELHESSPGEEGRFYDVYLREDDVIKLPTGANPVEHGEADSRVGALEERGIPVADTTVVDPAVLPGEYSHAVHQERLEPATSLDEIEAVVADILGITGDAYDRGILFPDNSLDNWGLDGGEVKRIDVADRRAVTFHADRDDAFEERLLESLGTLLYSLNRHFYSGEGYWCGFIADRTDVYDRFI